MPNSFAESIEPIDESPVLPIDKIEVPVNMTMSHPDWEKYVMSKFAPDELFDGRPKVPGLRRLVRLLLGRIVESYPDPLQFPTIENGQRSTCKFTVKVYQTKSLEEDEEPDFITFSDASDAWPHNVSKPEFAQFPVAMASTRAEGRALRKLLSLETPAAEEMSSEPAEEAVLAGNISESQITRIDIKCQQLDIDVMKFLNMGKSKFASVKDVTYIIATKMFKFLNEFERNIRPIPSEIQGYNTKWRD